MANIQSNLNKIKNAVLGVEVRDSIHDGIKAINEEVENTTDRQVQLEGTFDELVINAGNSNAEVAAARVDSTGKSHGTLGKRLNNFDSQIKEIKNELSYININSLGMFSGENITNNLNNFLKNINNEVVLYIPSGVYYIDNVVNLPKNVKIYGEKEHSIIKAISQNFRIYLNDNVTISNLTLDGNKDELEKTPTKLIDCIVNGEQIKNVVIENCNIGNMNTDTFCFGITIANTKNVIIKNCNFDYFNAKSNGIIGDNNGTSRSILISNNVDNCLIESCSFSGMLYTEDSDYIHINMGNDTVNLNKYPYNHEGRFNSSNVIIRNNIFNSCMKSAIKVQCSGVLISDNTIHFSDDVSSYSGIRVQNSSDCVIKNNTAYLNSLTCTTSVYTAQFCDKIIVDNNTVIFKSCNNAYSNLKPIIYYFYQVDNLNLNNSNIVGNYNIKDIINLSGENGVINISNINYNNDNSILNIIYIEKNIEKTDINLNNLNIYTNLNDYPIFYYNTSNKGVLKLNNTIINTKGNFSGKYKITYLRGMNELYINNVEINEKIDLGACEKVVINNSKFNGLVIKPNKLDMQIDNCKFYENYIRDNIALNLGLGEGKEYNIKVSNCFANCGNMFTIGGLNSDDKIISSNGVYINSTNNFLCEQAIKDKTLFIRATDGVTIPYDIFYLKTNQLLSGNITQGYLSSKKDINYSSGTLFLDDVSTNEDKGLYMSNGKTLVKIN